MANLTTNQSVDYIQKDYSSVVDSLISFATVNYGSTTESNRLWTNFQAGSFSRNWLELLAYVSDSLYFYLDTQATNAYLQTATVRSAVKLIAKQFGFTPASAVSSSGLATFTVSGPGTILRGFKVQATNGQQFYLTHNIVSAGAGTVTGTVLQGAIKTETFIAEGLQSEEFDLAGPNVIRDLQNLIVQDRTPVVVINGNEYTLVDSFLRFTGADLAPTVDILGNVIGGGGRVFTIEERPDGTNYIKFGDGIFGRKLVNGETVNITYRTGGGSAGNIPPETLLTLVDSSPIITSVNNSAEFSGGADEQSIEQLRQLIPASLRTLDRAVTAQDYSDLLIANFSEVFAASTESNTEDPGIDLNVYVVPQGVGIAKISDNPLLRTRLFNFLDRRKMVTIQFQLLDAFGVDVLVTFEIFIIPTASRNAIATAINTALQNFFNLSSGGASGSGLAFAESILLRDMTSVLDSIPGIERYEIKRLTYRPRIEKNIIGFITDYVTSEVKIYPNVEELEWLAAAVGSQTRAAGTVLYDNTALIPFTYNSATGEIAYTFPQQVDLRKVSPGDLFRGLDSGAGEVNIVILSVNSSNGTLVLPPAMDLVDTVNNSDQGSIRSAATTFQAYKVFKKVLAKATNLSIDSITDNDLDLSIITGEGSTISPRVLLDNTNVFIPGEYENGDVFLIDAASNVWEILENDSNTIRVAATATNDAAIVSLTPGNYSIVKKLIGSQILFRGSIFNIQYNNVNTLFSIGAQFSQIGTIGDDFQISTEQSNIGNIGEALDIIAYNAGTQEIRLNGSPNLIGVNGDSVIIDNTGQIFNVVGSDNRARPNVFYDETNRDSAFILQGAGLGLQVAQGFQVLNTDMYAIISLLLKREGNITGNLVARIVEDDGNGLPDLDNVVAVSEPINVLNITNVDFIKTIFSFTSPPTLSASTQYHIVLSSDAAYQSNFQTDVFSFDNSGDVDFTYSAGSGVIEFVSNVNLSLVQPGHYFIDGSDNLFIIQAVDNDSNQLILAPGLSVTQTTANDGGSAIIYDRVLVGIDSSSPTYADGELAEYDGASWSNTTAGPSNPLADRDAIFTVEGTKTIIIDSNLSPALGPNATVSNRYYDDENQISFVLGLSRGLITSAPNANALGRGTVAEVPNRPVDNFVFRTASYADDIVNLRLNELPEIDVSDIILDIKGGID